ncbi:retrotransposon protein, putative, ty1-copia subclass [Tanacetum coccineum]
MDSTSWNGTAIFGYLGAFVEDKLPFLEHPIPAMPVPPAGQVLPPDVLNTHTAWVKASKEIFGLMLMIMDPDIQKNLEQIGAYDMLKELKMLYAQQEDQELLQTVREFHACKKEEGQSVSSYVLKMKSYIDNLECLGHAMTQNLAVSLILVSLRKEYDSFMQNYSMHSMGKTKEGSKKNQKKKSHKAAKGNQGKGKAKMGNALVPAPFFAPKPKNPPTPMKDNIVKDPICHQCGEVGHWRRNCHVYLAELMKKRSYLNELALQSLIGSRKQKLGALSLYVGDGHHAAIEAIGEFHLCLPSGLVLILHNCHYAHSITRGIISVSRLYKDGFVNRFKNDNTISVSRNNLVYFNAIPRDAIYEIDLSSSNTNDSSMYVVSNKRAKLNLDSTLLWHCRLGYISKKRIKKLQHDGLLNSTNIKSFEKCVSCMSGKMARKPYSHQVERAKDLLRLIHTDEVENQLRKTIKSLRSDRGGEYMSQEFLDHLKEHNIIAHQTPPYTSQHNGVSERRNRTLLDMVHSMMSQTTLPKSFWDYALESAARILNIVLTKKVDKIPYEVWHGPAPKLSYLKVWGCEALVKHDTLTKPDKLEPRFIKSTRTRRATDRLCLYVDAEEHELRDLGKPANYKATLLDPESDKWLNAMNVEMQSMRDNKVWELVDLPPNGKTIGHKWLFKKKTGMDGAVYTYKARLVAKGFTQTTGIDYEETFSPVADIRAIKILIAIAAFYDYEIWQMDVKPAFLNGYLNKEVYMEQPEGFVNPKYPNRVCKLKHSIYGLKQASRKWNKRFDDEIKKFGFS